MPARDGTGPFGAGTMTGRGLGFCTGANAVKCGAGLMLGLGLGLGCRRGFRGGFRGAVLATAAQGGRKQALLRQKGLLSRQLEAVEKQLEDI